MVSKMHKQRIVDLDKQEEDLVRQLEEKQQFVKEKNQEISDLLEKQNRNGETKRAEGATVGGATQGGRVGVIGKGKKNREYDAV